MSRIATLTAVISALAAAGCATLAADEPVLIRLGTDAGEMVVEVDVEHAPISGCNFLSYDSTGRYDNGSFFRTVVAATNDNPNPIDVIQAATPAGSDDPGFGPVVLERTRDTGLRHVAGTISLARDGPDTATSSFFIVTQDTPSLDFGGMRHPDGQGFAAFGKLVKGLEIARAIQAMPADAEEQITPPVRITAARMTGEMPRQCWL